MKGGRRHNRRPELRLHQYLLILLRTDQLAVTVVVSRDQDQRGNSTAASAIGPTAAVLAPGNLLLDQRIADLDQSVDIGADALRRSSGRSGRNRFIGKGPGPGTPPSPYAEAAFRLIGITLSFGFGICEVNVSKARFFSTLVVVIFGFDTTFNRISYSTHGHDRHESHPLLLILA